MARNDDDIYASIDDAEAGFAGGAAGGGSGDAPGDGSGADGSDERGGAHRGRAGRILLAAAAAVVVLAAAVGLFAWHPWSPSASRTETGAPWPGSSSALPTAAPTLPVQTATAHTDPATPTTSPTASPTEGGGLPVLLTRWNWVPPQRLVSVAASIDTPPAAGGRCTLTLARDGVRVTATADATGDGAGSQCVVNLTSDSVSPGDWTVQIVYDGPAGHGASEVETLTVS